MIRQIMVIARKEIVDHAREIRSVSASLMHLLMGPFVVFLVSVSTAVKSNPKGVSALGGMVSIFALLATFVGGMNVAMDVVAGERERRSLLPLLLNPVSRLTVVIGKWLATSIFSLGGLAITLLAFMVVDKAAVIQNPLFSSSALVYWVLLGLAPLALLAAALQVAISVSCRTVKEAQTYLSFLIFFSMGIGMFLLFFSKKLTGWAAFLPIAGHQIIALEGLNTGHWSIPQALTLGLMTGWLTIVTVVVAGKLLERDGVVYGS
jgi:sodium transport system permease protein